jgi:hypothetical protein
MTRDNIIVIYLVGFLLGMRILAEMLWDKFRWSRYYRPWMSVVLGVIMFAVLVVVLIVAVGGLLLSEGRTQ